MTLGHWIALVAVVSGLVAPRLAAETPTAQWNWLESALSKQYGVEFVHKVGLTSSPLSRRGLEVESFGLTLPLGPFDLSLSGHRSELSYGFRSWFEDSLTGELSLFEPQLIVVRRDEVAIAESAEVEALAELAPSEAERPFVLSSFSATDGDIEVHSSTRGTELWLGGLDLDLTAVANVDPTVESLVTDRFWVQYGQGPLGTGIGVDDLSGSLLAEPDYVVARFESGSIGKDAYTGRFRFRVDAEEFEYLLDFRGEQVDSRWLLSGLTERERVVEGDAGSELGRASITFEGSGSGFDLTSLKGSGTVTIRGGQIEDVPFVRAVQERTGWLQFEGRTYDEFSYDYEVESHTVSLEPFVIATDVADLCVVGAIDLNPDLEIQLRTFLRVHLDLAENLRIHRVPDWVLTEVLRAIRKKRDYVVVPLTVTGTLRQPEASVILPDVPREGFTASFLAWYVDYSARAAPCWDQEGSLVQTSDG